MKKIINHKLYDTKTAELIAVYEGEKLYKSPKRTYFLYGDIGELIYRYGGPFPLLPADENGNDICLLSEKDVREWAIHRLPADEYISIFGEVEAG